MYVETVSTVFTYGEFYYTLLQKPKNLATVENDYFCSGYKTNFIIKVAP